MKNVTILDPSPIMSNRASIAHNFRWGPIVSAIGLTTAALATPAHPYKSALFSRLGLEPDFSLCQNLTAMQEYLNAGGNPNAILTGTGESKISLLQCAEPAVAVLLLKHPTLDVNAELWNIVATARIQSNQFVAPPQAQSMLKALLARGADVQSRTNPNVPASHRGETLLHATRTPEIAAVLVANGVDLNARDRLGRTPLHNASTDFSTQPLAIWLVQHGAAVNVADQDGVTPLHLATAAVMNIETVKQLVEHGANVRAQDKQRNTPLHDVAREDVIQFLMSQGADPTIRGKDGRTPLSIAAGNANSSIRRLQLLWTPKTNINAKDGYGMTPLHWAAKQGNPAVLKLLLARGATVDPRRNDGMTPLMLAAQTPNAERMRALLSHRADVQARDQMGRTPLHWVAVVDSIDKRQAFELLLSYRSPINARDHAGKTPLGLAAQRHLTGEVEFLKRKGGIE